MFWWKWSHADVKHQSAKDDVHVHLKISSVQQLAFVKKVNSVTILIRNLNMMPSLMNLAVIFLMMSDFN